MFLKNTVEAGIKYLEILLGTNQNILYPDIDFGNLRQREPLIKTQVDVQRKNK